jgi:hypothetical protein
MSSRMLCGLIASACLSGATVIGAQSPAPQTTTPALGASSKSPVITVIGCVQKETSVLKENPAATAVGMGDEFVLTNSKLSTGAPSTDQPAAATEPPAGDPIGTSGSASKFGKVYRVTGDKENELKTSVGQRVEISGAFKNEADAKTELSAASGRAVSGELTRGNTPEITIVSIKPSTGSCVGGGIH